MMIFLVAALAIALSSLLLYAYVKKSRGNFDKLLRTPIINPIDPSHRSKRVLIVGSGVSGLSAAKTFSQYGYKNITVLEASNEIGGVWRSNQYKGAALQVPYWLYQFADFRWPADLVKDVSPHKAAVQEYLRRYAEKYGIFDKVTLRYGCSVKKATRDGQRDVWVIDVSNDVSCERREASEGSGRTARKETIEAEILIMAVGNNSSSPIVPHLPNRESYSGTILHSSQVGDGTVLLNANKICIVGGSKSAYDVGQLQPDKTTIIMRTPHYWTPRWIVRLPFFDRISYHLFQGYRVRRNERSWLVQFLDWTMATFIAVGRNKPSHRSMLDDIMVGGGFHICTTAEAYRNSKRWDFEASSPSSYTDRGIMLENRNEIEADVIVWGTGFEPTKFFEGVFEGVELQDDLSDGLYLYKYIAHPSLPDCYFVGFKDPSLSVPTNASAQSLWAVFCSAAIAKLPEPVETREALDHRQRETRRSFPHSHRRAFYDYFLRAPDNCDYSYVMDLVRDCGLEGRVATFWRNPVDIWSSMSAFAAVLGARVELIPSECTQLV